MKQRRKKYNLIIEILCDSLPGVGCSHVAVIKKTTPHHKLNVLRGCRRRRKKATHCVLFVFNFAFLLVVGIAWNSVNKVYAKIDKRVYENVHGGIKGAPYKHDDEIAEWLRWIYRKWNQENIMKENAKDEKFYFDAHSRHISIFVCALSMIMLRVFFSSRSLARSVWALPIVSVVCCVYRLNCGVSNGSCFRNFGN